MCKLVERYLYITVRTGPILTEAIRYERKPGQTFLLDTQIRGSTDFTRGPPRIGLIRSPLTVARRQKETSAYPANVPEFR